MYSLVTFHRGCVNFVYTNSTISDLTGEIIEQFSNKRKKSRFSCRSCKSALHSSFFPFLLSCLHSPIPSILFLSLIPCSILFLNPLSSLTPLQWSIEMFHFILTYPASTFHLLYWQSYFVFNIDHCILLYYHLFIVQSIPIHSVLDWLISFIVLLWFFLCSIRLIFQPSLIVSLNFRIFLAASPSFHSMTSILHSILALVFMIVLNIDFFWNRINLDSVLKLGCIPHSENKILALD